MNALKRINSTKENDRLIAKSYLSSMTPRLTSSDESGLNDDLYAKRLLKSFLAELEAILPDTYHICQINYDSDPMGYTESMGVLLLVPADPDDHSYALTQHKTADRLVNKAFDRVCDFDPDRGGLVLSTYGVYPDGTLAIDAKP